MTTQIYDSEFRRLAAVVNNLSSRYRQGNDQWAGSPFERLKSIPSSRTRGKAFEDLLAEWCAACGLTVAPSPDSDADRIVSGMRVEVKGSTLWQNGGYKFQQIRDQNYSIIVCLGISPFDAHCWAIPKATVMQWWQEGKISSQHGGAGGSDTAWLSVNPSAAPDWLQPYGGTLSAGLAQLQTLTRRI